MSLLPATLLRGVFAAMLASSHVHMPDASIKFKGVSDISATHACQGGDRVPAVVQAQQTNSTDLAPLKARYASANANVREVIQRMELLRQQIHKVPFVAHQACLGSRSMMCMHGRPLPTLIRPSLHSIRMQDDAELMGATSHTVWGLS